MRDLVSSVGHVSLSIDPRHSMMGTLLPNLDLSVFTMAAQVDSCQLDQAQRLLRKANA